MRNALTHRVERIKKTIKNKTIDIERISFAPEIGDPTRDHSFRTPLESELDISNENKQNQKHVSSSRVTNLSIESLREFASSKSRPQFATPGGSTVHLQNYKNHLDSANP